MKHDSTVLINEGLYLEEIVRVARDGAKFQISDARLEAVRKCSAYVEEIISSGAIVYGVTTGFGVFANTKISRQDTDFLQQNLIRSHACGMGRALPTEVVRAAMLMRCNSLAFGKSGIRERTLLTLVEMLNKGVHPIVPEKGSLGASGDLAPLAHIVLVMMGEGEAEFQGEIMSGAEAMARANIPVVRLKQKEGLALINGTQIMTAISALAIHDAIHLIKMADIVAALSAEALCAITKAFDPLVSSVRSHKGQAACARNLMRLLEGSSLVEREKETRVQDAYSLRCIPQVHGASRDALNYVLDTLLVEINSVTDNPLIFPDEEEVISAGNFHGQPIALAMDFYGIAVAELANISERRIERMMNASLSYGLPGFLTEKGGLCSGFMIAQYSAASMVSENKIYAHPASVDSIPTSANQEDHVSMGTTAARKALQILENVRNVLAIELMSAAQALEYRDKAKLSPACRAVYDLVRKRISPLSHGNDMIMYSEMAKAEQLLRSSELLKATEAVIGELE
ncbi:MAG: histidine ammonia-lyase [Tissierellia bacterium]|nr:histidine ammonia-lyase [Bacillota bacterium]NLL22489.1 histidine ammonia-lyase [Tissierellia bacterium]